MKSLRCGFCDVVATTQQTILKKGGEIEVVLLCPVHQIEFQDSKSSRELRALEQGLFEEEY